MEVCHPLYNPEHSHLSVREYVTSCNEEIDKIEHICGVLAIEVSSHNLCYNSPILCVLAEIEVCKQVYLDDLSRVSVILKLQTSYLGGTQCWKIHLWNIVLSKCCMD
jgi:hypothetical protein